MLRAGPLEAEYFQGSLRAIRCGGREVIRQIYFAVRDARWDTVPCQISEENIQTSGEGFHIRFRATHLNSEVAFGWRGVVEGSAEGTILFSASGAPLKSFFKNRIGLCVLHPLAECAGEPCIVEHTDGSREVTAFPRDVSPHQPFLDVRSISYEISPGLRAGVTVRGDVFETEDHRNWTDASFKTYSTPLSLPRPIEVTPDDRVEQSAQLRIAPVAVRITLDRARRFAVPELRTGRVEVRFQGGAARISGTRQARAEVAIFSDRIGKELPAALEALRGMDVSRWLVFSADGAHTTADGVAEARRLLPSGSSLGGGTSQNFAEVNRNRDALSNVDFVAWGINPAIHANDPRTIVENLEGQAATVHTARRFAPGKPLHISPLRVPDIAGREGWLALTLANMAYAGAASIVCAEPATLLDELRQFSPDDLVAAVSTSPLQAGALAARKGDSIHVWLVNLRDAAQAVELEGRQFTLLPNEVRRTGMEAR